MHVFLNYCILSIWGNVWGFNFLCSYILSAYEVMTKKDVCFEGTKSNAYNIKIRLSAVT